MRSATSLAALEITKWDSLSAAMTKENTGEDVFLKARIASRVLEAAYEEGRAALIESGDKIVGYGVLWETAHPQYLEIGSLYVCPDQRGKGFAHSIFGKLIALAKDGRHCFTISHNPRVVSMATHFGMREATTQDWLHLAPFAVSCGPCDRAIADKHNCPFRAVTNECRLFVL